MYMWCVQSPDTNMTNSLKSLQTSSDAKTKLGTKTSRMGLRIWKNLVFTALLGCGLKSCKRINPSLLHTS
jgi:hypothetical protein